LKDRQVKGKEEGTNVIAFPLFPVSGTWGWIWAVAYYVAHFVFVGGLGCSVFVARCNEVNIKERQL
jgi:uncharacterized membrane protein (DUF485 family)